MKNVQVGMFKLPGISFEKGELSAELNEEMQAWANAEGVGMSMTESLWSFKKESHREWFILKWIDRIPKIEKETNNLQVVTSAVASVLMAPPKATP
jgi:hypothetical protein